MVLYYLKHSMPNRDVPTYLIDTNVRIDYGKLRHLLVVGRQLNGNFDLLRNIIGEERVDVLRIQPSFPLKQLTDEENFLSLLHYFGLLSIREVTGGALRLGIPNQTVKRLMYGYLRDAHRDVEVFRISLFRFEQSLMRMANKGEWRPAFEFLGEAIARQTRIRDYIAGEKVMAPRAGALGFLAAYLSLADYYVLRSEVGKGHADIALEPLVARHPHLQRGYLIELKYRARSEPADQAAVTTVVEEAQAQLLRYLADEPGSPLRSGSRCAGCPGSGTSPQGPAGPREQTPRSGSVCQAPGYPSPSRSFTSVRDHSRPASRSASPATTARMKSRSSSAASKSATD